MHTHTSLVHVVLMGCPGGGKTTQVEKLLELWDGISVQYEMGSLMKKYCSELGNTTILGSLSVDGDIEETRNRRHIYELIQRGKLRTQTPVELIEMVWKRFISTLSPNIRLCVYYGGPGSLEEAKRMIFKPDLVLVLHTSERDEQILIDRVCHRRIDVLTGRTYHLINDRELLQELNIWDNAERLKCRLGDDEILFKQRLVRYRNRSEPIIQFYESVLGKDSVIRIDATQSREHVHNQIKHYVNQLIPIVK
jgi:adenylate kinase family enzyme